MDLSTGPDFSWHPSPDIPPFLTSGSTRFIAGNKRWSLRANQKSGGLISQPEELLPGFIKTMDKPHCSSILCPCFCMPAWGFG